MIHSRPKRNNEDKEGKELLLAVDKSSVELLKSKSGVVKFGLGVVWIKILNEDRKSESEVAGSAD